MKLMPTAGLPLIVAVTLFSVAGCSTTRAVDPSKYDGMECVELNKTLGGVAVEISRTGIMRGKVAQTSVPTWLPGGSRVVTAVANRETARIEHLKQQEAAIVAARNRKCPAAPQ